jgi:acetoacetyl-CoA synthetase
MQKPIWSPSPERIERANLSRFMRFVREETGNADLNSYAPLWQFSVDQPERFWTLVWDFCGIKASGAREPMRVDGDAGRSQWFPNVRLNIAQNLLRFDDERTALLQRGADGQFERISYSELRARVARLAAAMKAAGIAPGDHVAGALVHGADAIVIALACAALGAAWVGASASESAAELAARLAPQQPKLLFASRRPGATWLATLAALLPSLQLTVCTDDTETSAPLRAGAITLAAFVAAQHAATLEFTALPFDQPLYVLGKGEARFVHGAGGTLIQHLKELVLQLDLKREDKLLVATEVGSHAWTWAVSSLALGCSVLLHDAAVTAANAAALWDRVDESGVSVMLVDAGWVEASREAGLQPGDSHKLLHLKTVVAADRLLASDAVEYLYDAVKARLMVGSAWIGPGRIGCIGLLAPLLPVLRDEPPCRALGMRGEPRDGVVPHGAAEVPDCVVPHPSRPLARCSAAPRPRKRGGAALRLAASSERPAPPSGP